MWNSLTPFDIFPSRKCLIRTSPSERLRHSNQKFITSIYSSPHRPCKRACTRAVYLGGKSAAAGRRVGTYSSVFVEGISRDERPNIRTQQDRGGTHVEENTDKSASSPFFCVTLPRARADRIAVPPLALAAAAAAAPCWRRGQPLKTTHTFLFSPVISLLSSLPVA